MCDHQENSAKPLSRRKVLCGLATAGLSLPLLELQAFAQKSRPIAQKTNPGLQTMLSAAEAFLNLLNADLQRKAIFPLGSDEQFRWHYIPTAINALPPAIRQNAHERNGVSIQEMNSEQRLAAHTLLRSALSTQGYLKATSIMYLEEVLREIESTLETAPFLSARNSELYFFAVFGTPAKDKPWGWRVEGHHLSLHFSWVSNELVIAMPAFMGTNPAIVRHGTHKGSRILAAEEELAREFLQSLTSQQTSQVIIEAIAPQDIITRNGRKATIGLPVGLAASRMNGRQRGMLMRLIGEYVGNFNPALAEMQLKKIEQVGIEKIHFAWAGSTERGKAHYYRIHSPKWLIEYDNTQNNANHIHTVCRDLENDFGGDALRRHYEKGGHHS
ncbi:MAG: DUF3500 domain-containing protein [Acidobacteriota bacterium]